MFIVDVLLRIVRAVEDLAHEMLIRPELPTAPSQEAIDRAVESLVESMVVDRKYPRLAKWIEEHETNITTEILGVFRVQ